MAFQRERKEKHKAENVLKRKHQHELIKQKNSTQIDTHGRCSTCHPIASYTCHPPRRPSMRHTPYTHALMPNATNMHTRLQHICRQADYFEPLRHCNGLWHNG